MPANYSGDEQQAPAIERIPIYLLTGFLGSGKSTLLARWLKEPLLRDAALIVNEIGAVGLDHATLGHAGESSMLLADACVCCTGLPGLHEALEDLFWARLHRRIARFNAVVIETTGLANPGPLLASLRHNPLVEARYRVAAVFTTLGAPTALRTIAEFDEARAQLNAAGLIVLTKTDLVASREIAAIEGALRESHPGTRIAHSANGSLSAADACLALQAPNAQTAPRPFAERKWQSAAAPQPRSGFMPHGRAMHRMHTRFEPIDHPISREALHGYIDRLIARHAGALVRLKGIVRLADGGVLIAQFAQGDASVALRDADEATSRAARRIPSGVTLILRARPTG